MTRDYAHGRAQDTTNPPLVTSSIYRNNFASEREKGAHYGYFPVRYLDNACSLSKKLPSNHRENISPMKLFALIAVIFRSHDLVHTLGGIIAVPTVMHTQRSNCGSSGVICMSMDRSIDQVESEVSAGERQTFHVAARSG